MTMKLAIRKILTSLVLVAGCFLDSADCEDQVHYLLKTNALNYQENKEVDTKVQGNCVNGPPEGGSPRAPDAQTTLSDENCRTLGPCHIGFTQRGEYVVYEFQHTDEDVAYYDDDGYPIISVNITLRAAAPRPRNVYMELYNDGHELADSTSVTINSGGYQVFEDILWTDVRLEPYNPHSLLVSFAGGNVNLCSVVVSSIVRTARPIPFVINALDYDDAGEVDKDISGNCIEGQPPIDEPDAQNTKDGKCLEHGPCHIAFTNNAEFVVRDHV
jgi:hypothetical protein